MKHNKLIILFFVFVIFIGVLSGCPSHDSSPDLVYSMVNVNHTNLQGDAHVIKAKNGKTILIDAGLLEPAKEKLVPFLQKSRIKKIDIAFVSHPHRDHYEGLLPILDADIKIKEAYFNISDKEICDYEIPWGCNYRRIVDYRDKLEQQNVNIKLAKPGLLFDLGNGATIKILYAFDGVHTPVGKTDVNDLSLVMVLKQFGHKILFTGDLNRPIGGYLAQKASNEPLFVVNTEERATKDLFVGLYQLRSHLGDCGA